MNSEIYYYRAFGLNIASEIEVKILLPLEDNNSIDVNIVKGDLSSFEDGAPFINDNNRTFFLVPDSGRFYIENGNKITVDIFEGTPLELIAVYVLGSCMGAILHQRNYFLLHGSCVTKDGKAILITGDSGAGKSTLAAEFLSQGWKLLTDDVAVVNGIEEGKPMVQASYPSQKLWQDAIDRIDYNGEKIPLFQEDRREKFNIRVQEFIDGTAQLVAVVRLIPTENICDVSVVDGFAKVDQLMKNTYRFYMISEGDRQTHFQRCVTLSGAIKMLVAARESNANSSHKLYEMITKEV